VFRVGRCVVGVYLGRVDIWYHVGVIVTGAKEGTQVRFEF